MNRRPIAAGLAAAAFLAAATPAAAQVAVVGDSLGVGTTPHLERELSPLRVHGDSRTGRPSTEGPPVLGRELRPDDEVVVYDLGTNDLSPSTLQASLLGAGELVGDRCMVIATINKPGSVEGLNRVVTGFASSRERTEVVNWRQAVQADPGLLAPDGVHASPAGYAARARLVATAVNDCLAGPKDLPPPRRRRGPRRAPAPPLDLSGLRVVIPLERSLEYLRTARRLVDRAVRQARAIFGPLPEPVLGAERSKE